MSLKTAFMGTPDFAVPALQALIDAGHNVVCIYSQPPKPAGRGHKITKSSVQLLAERYNIEVRTPRSLQNTEEQDAFRALDLDVAVVAAYGLILPQAVLDAPRMGCLNIHGSLLPRWRGAAPIHRAILAGDTETGITIMQMDAGLDTGAMLAKFSIPITAQSTTQQLHDQLSILGAEMLIDVLQRYSLITPETQPQNGATYAHKITKEEGRIDWTKSAPELDRQIRALNPWPGAWFEYHGDTIKILAAEIVDQSGKAGTLLDQDFTVACGTQALRLLRVQRSGKTSAIGADFLRGFLITNKTAL